jgi:hypothetical protein
MGRPNIGYLNECRTIRRETGIHKSKWRAPKHARPEPVQPGERISRSLRPASRLSIPQAAPSRNCRTRASCHARRLRNPVLNEKAMTAIDRTRAGPQHVLPGAEKASDATMARRAAAKPLRASAPQQPCDIGLFSNDAAQSDLLHLIGRD